MEKKKDEKFISLKEAAKVSGYTADHIGYLIRTGKIKGKQVFVNVSWVTTAEEVLGYKNRKEKRVELSRWQSLRQKIVMEAQFLLLFIKTFKFVLPVLAVLVASVIALIYFFVTFSFSLSDQREGEDQTIFSY